MAAAERFISVQATKRSAAYSRGGHMGYTWNRWDTHAYLVHLGYTCRPQLQGICRVLTWGLHMGQQVQDFAMVGI